MNAPVRLAFVTGSKVIWGAELSLLTIGQYGAPDGLLLTSNPALGEAWELRGAGRSLVINAPSGRLSRGFRFAPSIFSALRTVDVLVVFDFYLLPMVLLLRLFSFGRRAKVAIDVHDSSVRNPNRRPFFWLMRACNSAICVSEFVAAQLPKSLPRQVIYRPVSIETPPADPIDSSDPIVGIVGQVSPDKDVKAALSALSSFAGIEVLVRGGATPENEAYRAEVRELGDRLFGARFTDEGRVPQERAMHGISALVLTNADEPFGRVAAEAQLAGVLVVGPNQGGIPEIISDGETGFTYSRSDPNSLESALRRAVLELERPSGLVDRARAAASRRFSPHVQSTTYVDALRQLAR